MAHYAILDNKNIVIQVITGKTKATKHTTGKNITEIALVKNVYELLIIPTEESIGILVKRPIVKITQV